MSRWSRRISMIRMEDGNVADFVLKPAPFLGGYDQSFDRVRLREIVDIALMSLAIPLQGERAAAAAIKAALGCDLPEPGRSTMNGDGTIRVFQTAADQYMAVSAAPVSPDALGDAAYVTDQTHSWAVLELSGPGCRDALERLCPLDLHPDAFAIGAAARTVMEHMGAVILRSEADTFLLMVGSSFAKTFLHAVETSVAYTS